MIVILAVVFFILWKYTHVLDGLKAKIKGQQEKWKKNAAEAAQREREKEKQEREKEFEAIREKQRQKEEAERQKREEEARELEEKRVNCEHSYYSVSYGTDDDLFPYDTFYLIDKEGHSVEECSKCGKKQKGEVVAKINCKPIKCNHDDPLVDEELDEELDEEEFHEKFVKEYENRLSTEIYYDYKGNHLCAGSYTVWLDKVTYLLVNRNIPRINIDKGDICIAIQIKSDSVSPYPDYPAALDLVKYLRFVDKEGVPILDDTPLSSYKIDIKEKYEIAEEKFGCEFYSLGENEREECRREAERSHMAMLKVPNQECELRVFAEFSDSQEDE